MPHTRSLSAVLACALAAGCGSSSSDGSNDGATSDGATNDGATSETAPADSTAADQGADLGADTPSANDAGAPGTSATVGPCRIFPPDSPWNRYVSGDPLSAHGADYLAAMNTSTKLHPDWGDWSTNHYGIPWQMGTGAPQVAFSWQASWGNTDSDPDPCATSQYCYPIPTNAKIEGGPSAAPGDDRHLLLLDTAGAPNDCTLYEVYQAQNFSSPPWLAANGAIFHLGSTTLRADGLTSADAAGLPILPGLVRYDEVAAGEVQHAIRFTMNTTSSYFIHPATHAASSHGLYAPPMGLRLRMKVGTDVAAASSAGKVIFAAMKKYGVILADNGSDWYFGGDSDDRWAPLMDALVADFGRLHGSDFEVVETGTPIAQP